MSIRQGNNILAGGVVCDNAPTSGSQNAVSSGGVYTALAGKVSTGHEVIEYQAPTAENNYTWYRKYADGWVEQGGFVSVTGHSVTSDATITLPIEMANSSYNGLATILGAGENIGVGVSLYIISSTQISLRINYSSNLTRTIAWQVSGLSAN